MKTSTQIFRVAIMNCTHDDQVWNLVKLVKDIGDDETKALATKLSGMNVDEAHAYLKNNP